MYHTIQTYAGAMVAFDDGDPDKIPLWRAKPSEIVNGIIEEGWFAHWVSLESDDIGSWNGPFDTENLAQEAAIKDWFETFEEDIQEELQAKVVSGEP